MDHNAYVQDPTHEALRVDSITDYLPRADYIANDAILYWQFQKLHKQIPELAQQQMESAFHRFSHHAVCLITQMPPSFIEKLTLGKLEDALYLAQMDWLFGTESGLLFRVREELFGLLDGYDRVFWPELESRSPKNSHRLSVNCQVHEKDWVQLSVG